MHGRARVLLSGALVLALAMSVSVVASPAIAAEESKFLPAAEQAVKDSYTVVLTTIKPEEVGGAGRRRLRRRRTR
jgi:hypothetical protein